MITDSTLLDNVRDMNEDALAEIFDLYAPPLYSYALRFCRNPLMADQVVGDVFAKLLDHLSQGKGPTANLRSYLFQVAYHLLVDEVRYSNAQVSLEVFDLVLSDGDDRFREVESSMIFETVSEAMRKELTQYQRQVIILRFLEGFSLYETAEILGKSVNVIKAAQHKAIMTLRDIVGYQENEVAVT